MKRVLKLLGLVLAVVVALKLNDIYHNAYPKFKSEACDECQELTEAPNGKTVNLFFRDTMSEGWFQVRDIYYKQNIWDRRKWIGQSLDYNGGNQDAGLQMMLYFSSYELPPYSTRGNIHEEDSMMISEVPITLMKGVYDDAELLFYDFKFEYDSLYVCGTMRITRRDEKQFSSDEEKKEWIGFILEKMFWSSPA